MPDFSAQFRSTEPQFDHVYMGGTAMSCGDHPSLPKRHRWGPWKRVRPHLKAWERTCKVCALVDDIRWDKPRGWKEPAA